jgi:coenzyme F420-reducing hydrogenase gamma subunit
MPPILIDPQIFGGLVADVRTIKDQQDEIFEKLDVLSVHGCAMGQKHSEDIKELKEKPAKLVALGAIIIGALASIGAGAIWLHSKLGGG